MSGPEQAVGLEAERSGGLSFQKSIHLFPEEQRPEAERYAEIVDQAYASDLEKAYDLTLKFCQEMIKAYGRDSVGDLKLYHLLAGSSLTNEQCRTLPLDTDKKEFGHFIDETLKPLIK